MAINSGSVVSIVPLLSPAKTRIAFGTPIPRALSPLSSLIVCCKPISATGLRAAPPRKYVYPDPIPEFAESETKKFRAELLKELAEEKVQFGDDLDEVVDVCAKILSDFLHEEYGGPGTLLIEPFTDMLLAIKAKNLPGASAAARASLLWAQNYIDQDWEVWNSNSPK